MPSFFLFFSINVSFLPIFCRKTHKSFGGFVKSITFAPRNLKDNPLLNKWGNV